MKMLKDTWLMFQRYLFVFLRNPAWVAIGVLQPVLYLVLFAPLLKSLDRDAGVPVRWRLQRVRSRAAHPARTFRRERRRVRADRRACAPGVIERFRVTPVSRFALLLGRALRDILTLVVQSLILLLLAIPFGLKPTVSGVFVMLGLVALIGLGMSSLAYAAALALKSEDSYAPLIFTLSLPLLLLSGVLLPLAAGAAVAAAHRSGESALIRGDGRARRLQRAWRGSGRLQGARDHGRAGGRRRAGGRSALQQGDRLRSAAGSIPKPSAGRGPARPRSRSAPRPRAPAG